MFPVEILWLPTLHTNYHIVICKIQQTKHFNWISTFYLYQPFFHNWNSSLLFFLLQQTYLKFREFYFSFQTLKASATIFQILISVHTRSKRLRWWWPSSPAWTSSTSRPMVSVCTDPSHINLTHLCHNKRHTVYTPSIQSRVLLSTSCRPQQIETNFLFPLEHFLSSLDSFCLFFNT